MKRFITGTILILVGFSSSLAQAVVEESHFLEGQLEMGVGFRYLKTDSNYTSMGSSPVLNGPGRSYSTMDIDLYSRYVVVDKWGLYGGMTFANSESTNTDATRRNPTVSQVLLGTDVLLLYGRHFLWGNFDITSPVARYDKNTDTALTSDGVIAFGTGLNYLFPWNNWTIEGNLGFDYRLEGRSALLPWEVSGSYHFGRWYTGLGFSGFQTVIEDADTNARSVRDATLVRANGGSYIYSSINPSVVFVELKGGRLSQGSNQLEVILRSTVSGAQYAAYTELAARWTWFFGNEKDTRSLEKKIRQIPVNFEVNTDDGVDQNLFKGPPTQLDAYKNRKRNERRKQYNSGGSNNPADSYEESEYTEDSDMTVDLKEVKKSKKKSSPRRRK